MPIKVHKMTQHPGSALYYPEFTDDSNKLSASVRLQVLSWLHGGQGTSLQLLLPATGPKQTGDPRSIVARTLTIRRGPYRIHPNGPALAYYYVAAYTEDHKLEILGPLEKVRTTATVVEVGGLNQDYEEQWPAWNRAYPELVFGHAPAPAQTAILAHQRETSGASSTPNRTVDDEFSDLPSTKRGDAGFRGSLQSIEVLRETQLAGFRVVTSKALHNQFDATMHLLALAAGAVALAAQSDSKEYPFQTFVFDLENNPLVQHFRRYKTFEAALQGHEEVVASLRGEYDAEI